MNASTENSVVVKIGGSLMESPEALRSLTKALAELWLGGMPLILAHGGGKDINRNLGWLGEEPRFKNGLRVTSEAAMEIVEMTLSGAVNKRLVSLLQLVGARACGLSGVDGSTLICRPLDPEPDPTFYGQSVGLDRRAFEGSLFAGAVSGFGRLRGPPLQCERR